MIAKGTKLGGVGSGKLKPDDDDQSGVKGIPFSIKSDKDLVEAHRVIFPRVFSVQDCRTGQSNRYDTIRSMLYLVPSCMLFPAPGGKWQRR